MGKTRGRATTEQRQLGLAEVQGQWCPQVRAVHKQKPAAPFPAEISPLSHTHIPLLFPVFRGASLPLVTVWAVPFAKINKDLIFAIWMQRTEAAPMGTGTEVRDSAGTQSPGREWDPCGTLEIARRS